MVRKALVILTYVPEGLYPDSYRGLTRVCLEKSP